jgi:small subunit ribosomal protein S20
MRQAKTHTARNKSQRSALRTALKRVNTATGSQESGAAILEATKLIDRAGRKRLIHPNTAARQKSKLARAAKK